MLRTDDRSSREHGHVQIKREYLALAVGRGVLERIPPKRLRSQTC